MTRGGWELKRGFLPREELAARVGELDSRPELFAPVAVKAGMNLPYSVLDGARLKEGAPELYELAAGRLLRAAEAAFETKLELMRDPKRSVRVQRYRASREGFRWHVDGGLYSALLTLRNTNGGATELLGETASRWLRPVPYLLFPFPGLLELAGPTAATAEAGDLLLVRGGDIIHRGVNRSDEGERLVLVATFDPVGRRPTPVWDWFARRLNY